MTSTRWHLFFIVIMLVSTIPAPMRDVREEALLLCHRTANRDVPENSLESLALAARMGCDIVEVDVRRTLDGQLVLNHDGFLDRFTNSTGEVENTDLRELDRMDFVAWQGERFRGMRIAHFDDALRLAHAMKVNLFLDIKSKGIGAMVLDAVAREGMTDSVRFGGESEDIRALNSQVNPDPVVDLQPGFDKDEVPASCMPTEGWSSPTSSSMGMRAIWKRCAQRWLPEWTALWSIIPRLGAEAVGRPVEERVWEIIATGWDRRQQFAHRRNSGVAGIHWLSTAATFLSLDAGLRRLRIARSRAGSDHEPAFNERRGA